MIENTYNMLGGLVLDANYLSQFYKRAHKNNCQVHTDGARLINRQWADQLNSLGFDVVKPHTNIVLINMKTAVKAESMVIYLASKNIHVQQAAEAN